MTSSSWMAGRGLEDVDVVGLDDFARAVEDEAAPLGLGMEGPEDEGSGGDESDDGGGSVAVIEGCSAGVVLGEDDPADLRQDDHEEGDAGREAGVGKAPVGLASRFPKVLEWNGSIDAVVFHHADEHHRAREHGKEHESDDRGTGRAVEDEKDQTDRVRQLHLHEDDHR
eukprot:CAMPEP_0197418530 /NCGR_PEP_ID=MMETSP1170-20131217/4220_1 /TAXON_ID=54406 /ORGANISM="Sarcinochrysis sp, Strain CCMP770" /LENGTH=168 /DNA_ID=CAMNT_0042945571 /DNA_START=179 /DNA_END=681 /DNA_ORIENTATION=+